MTDSKEPVKFGTSTRFGDTRCGYGVDLPECQKPAVWHLLWLNHEATSATCEEHLEFINSRPNPGYDKHTHAANCGMPGTLWHWPYEDESEGYCLFPANDDLSTLAAAELIPVGGES